jgi:hypothetical protein
MNQLRKFTSLCVAAIFGFVFLTGCGQKPAAESQPAAQTSAPANNPSTQPITQTVSQFMDAVIKGDTQGASALLTPQATQRIINSGVPFAPPGFQNATFRVAEIRTPEVGKAYVQCVLTVAPPGAQPQSEEMCWVLKQVGNDWRISGFAAWGGPNGAGVMTDLETGNTVPLVAPSTAPSTPVATPGLPPRMATEPAPTAPR